MANNVCNAIVCFLLLSSSLHQLVQAAVVCPPKDAFQPCYCFEYIGKPDTITLDCLQKNLTDSRIGEILIVFLTTADISPVAQIDLTSNQLTRVPIQIRSFSELEDVFLDDNPITSIESGDFNTTRHNPSISIGSQLTTIAPGSFKGDDNHNSIVEINVGFNQLTRFEASVFQSVLEKFASFGGYPKAYVEIKSNPIDCSDCHVSWLIRDNRHLISAVHGGKCSNETAFQELDPLGYADCPWFVCPLGYDGFFTDPETCSKFYTCKENIARSNDCPTDLVFNPVTNECEAVANVPRCAEKKATTNEIITAV